MYAIKLTDLKSGGSAYFTKPLSSAGGKREIVLATQENLFQTREEALDGIEELKKTGWFRKDVKWEVEEVKYSHPFKGTLYFSTDDIWGDDNTDYGIKESIVENYKDNVLITSTDQMLDGMMGNASDKDIDDTIRLVNAIKRFWHHPTDYEPLVAIVDSEYDPSVFQDSLKAEKQPLSNTRYKDIDVYFIDRKDGDKGAGIRFAREEKNGKIYLYFHDAVSLEDYFGRIDRMYDEFDDSYDEETKDEYTEIATKSVRDSDGMMTDYTWYRRNSDGLNIFMFGDKDVYTPDAEYADWETESDEQAEEWFDNYDGFEEEFEEEDDFSDDFEEDDDYEPYGYEAEEWFDNYEPYGYEEEDW